MALSDGFDTVSLLDGADVRDLARGANAVLHVVIRRQSSAPVGSRGWVPYKGPGNNDALQEAAEATGGRFRDVSDKSPMTDSLQDGARRVPDRLCAVVHANGSGSRRMAHHSGPGQEPAIPRPCAQWIRRGGEAVKTTARSASPIALAAALAALLCLQPGPSAQGLTVSFADALTLYELGQYETVERGLRTRLRAITIESFRCCRAMRRLQSR